MRVRTYMRRLRGPMTVTEVAARTGIAKGTISMYERGQFIPAAIHVEMLTAIYGPLAGWYPAKVLAVFLPALGECPGCGEELEPDASGRRIYHDDKCKAEARRRRHPSQVRAILPGFPGYVDPGEEEGPPAEGAPVAQRRKESQMMDEASDAVVAA